MTVKRPLECLVERATVPVGACTGPGCARTADRYRVQDGLRDIPQAHTGIPTYGSLPLDQYFSMMRLPNASARLQIDMRWYKLPLAHGYY